VRLAADGRATGGGLTIADGTLHLVTMTLTLDNADIIPQAARSWKQAMWRGFRRHCPNCGKGYMYRAYLKVADTCGHCGEELHHHRADDAPPYFTMFIAGHIVIPSMLIVERVWHPPLDVHFVLWTVLTLALTFALLPAVKGAIVGLQWALRMHGFDYSAARESDG
jgi:uncharacterized protein (DUF983 family)